MKDLDYKHYRWFITSAGKIVVGGKSSTQNDELLKKLKASKKEYIVMHTTEPGSPFTVILDDPEKVLSSEIDETAIFTGCFSRAWKSRKKHAKIDIFRLSQLYKASVMKSGTWGVKPPIKRVTVDLQLVLAKQKGTLRAVPPQTVKDRDVLLAIKPGKIDKTEMLPKLQVEMSEHPDQNELLAALPAGGVSIVKEKR